MLETFLRYAQGYVAIPVVVALRDAGFFDLLDRQGAFSVRGLASELHANEGHLAVATRLLASLGWIGEDADRRIVRAPSAALVRDIPRDIGTLIALPLDEYLRGAGPGQDGSAARLTRWLDLSARRWDTPHARLADWLDGVLVLPVLVAASRLTLFEPRSDRFSALPADVRVELARLLTDRGWAIADPGGRADAFALTDLGRHLVDRAFVMGVAASYAPMLRHVDELLFGSPARVLQARAAGHEVHVDRSLNVVASGFQHERYFRDIDEILLEVFDRLPLDRQPRYVADMGSGDGALLERVSRVVRERTARGRNLASRPLTLIAADLNDRALDAARARLRDVPCLFVHADIGDPAAFVETLRSAGVHDPEAILHLRSFLDHDRTLSPAIDGRRAAERRLSDEAGVFVDAAGASVPPAHVVQDLVEHLERWAAITGPTGLVVLEVHSLPARVVREHIDRCENLYFDALQGFSGQLLVPAATFVMAAAEAGLFPRVESSRRYPATLPFTRITLSWFERRPYRIRPARAEDVPALVALEISACEEGTRASEPEIRRRVVEAPDGHCVLEMDGRLAGVLYTQRIASPDVLFGRTIEDLADVRDPAGRFVQLIGLRVDPVMQQRGLGDQFLDFALHWLGLQSPIEAAVGVSRCRDFANQSRPLADYVSARDANGRALDPILRFHQDHGARIEGVVPGFCPGDLANEGAGVLIRYDFQADRAIEPAAASQAVRGARAAPADVAAHVEACVRRVLGPRRARAIDPSRPLMELGMDSLDLMELRAQLETTLDVTLDQTFFFEYGTCDAVVARLAGSLAAPVRAQGGRGDVVTSAARARPLHRTAEPVANQAPIAREAIAIVGMACRFPGGVDDPERCWHFLREGRDAVAEVPEARRARWEAANVASFFEAYPWIRRGAFLQDVAGFDASFFNVAPREAALIDPQQRLLLEVAWEALEHAAINPQRLAGTRAGVFLGIFSHDYELLQVTERPSSYFDAYSATGVSPSLAAGRIAYCLGLEGPAVTIDTACSSSLVAAHLACQSLRSGESDLAMVGGANLMLAPNLSIIFAKAGMLSAEGRCKSFAAGADGYVRGEGCGVVVLKRLGDAVRAGDRIAAVIRGSAINQDGASNGLTAPSVRAQEKVVRSALEDAGIDPADVDYLEAHGTGTSLGDPIEIEALGRVFGGGRDRAHPLRLGSIKTGFGHLEAAAGLAGLMKAVLCLQHRELVPHLHFEAPSPLIPWNDLPIEVVTSPTPMPECRVAGVSSFGFSGTNAHVVLEAWPVPAPIDEPPADGIEPQTHVLTLSARTPSALRAAAVRMRERLLDAAAPPLADVCYTAASGRAHFEHRLAVAGQTLAETVGHLSSFLAGSAAPGYCTGRAARSVPGVAWLFTGQGSQYFGMGRELFEREPVYRHALETCAAILEPRLDVPLLQVLGYATRSDPISVHERVHQTRYTQPALFAIEYALAELWRSWGVTPDVVLGHSVGEYVAACVAGVFGLEDALGLLATRAALMQAQPEAGAMAAVMADEATVERARRVFGDRVSIAAVNGPANTVISGERDAVHRLRDQLAREGLTSTPLPVSHAFHSALMDPVLDDFETAARRVTFAPPRIRIVSNLTGALAGDEICEPGYWARHLRAPVRFGDGVAAALGAGASVFLELGPRPVLIGMARRAVATPVAWLASLDGTGHDQKRLRQTLAELYVRGLPIQWDGVHAGQPRRKVGLPTYPFERESLWFDDRPARPAPVPAAAGRHPLLGQRLRSPRRDSEYAVALDARFADHRVGSQSLVPGAACVELALGAARERLRGEAVTGTVVTIDDLTWLRPLRVSPDDTSELRALVRPDAGGGSMEVELHRLLSDDGSATDADDRWELHARARVTTAPPAASAAGTTPVPELLRRCPATLPVAEFYQRCEERGLRYGPAFRVLTELHLGDGEAIGRVVAIDRTGDSRYCLDPVLLDGCFQVALAAVFAAERGSLFVPSAIDRVRARLDAVPRDGRPLWSQAVLRAPASPGHGSMAYDVRIVDDDGRSVAEIDGLSFRRTDPASLSAPQRTAWRDCVYDVEWVDDSVSPPVGAGSALPWLNDLRERVSGSLRDAGHHAQANLARTLEARSVAHAAAALDELGWRLRPGDPLDERTLCRHLGIAPRHRQLFTRLLRMIGDVEVADRGTPLPSADAPEIELLDRCGAALAQVLRGECDPLQLIFPGGDMTRAARLYSEGLSFKAMNGAIARAIAEIVGAADVSGLRLLELGAGTGGTTARVLPLLPPDTAEYLFTDLSPRFTSEARVRFAAFPFVRAQRLDIEADPHGQGVELAAYDVVLASNVLHATRDLRQTLTHARRLLRPGGQLIVLEGTAPRRWIDLTFGLLDGWWRFEDRHIRSDYPLLSTAQWRDLLAELGFDRVSDLAPEADPAALGFPQAILVARRAPQQTTPTRGRWLVLGGEDAIAGSIADRLRAAGQAVALVRGGDQLRPSIEAAAHDPVDGVVDVRPAERGEDADAETAADAGRGGSHSWTPVLDLVQALAPTAVRNVWVVTRGGLAANGRMSPAGLAQATVSGLRRVVALEHPALRCRQIDLDPAQALRDQDRLVAGELLWETGEDEVAFRLGRRLVPRLVRRRDAVHVDGEAPLRVERGDTGSLESLRLVPVERRAPGPGEVEISVRASGLNFLDVLDALGVLPFDRPEGLGLECAGEIVRVGTGVTGLNPGDRVMAIAGGSLSRYVVAQAALTARCSDGMLDEVAASIPVAFLTAAYALRVVADLRAGQRILVHAGAGGTGMAAVQMAVAAGAEVFATASPWKADTLRAMGVRHVASSRTLDFSGEILRLTDGRGVDVVLNSLAGDAIEAGLACVADRGHFVELGKTRLLDDAAVAAIRPGVRYTPVDLRRLCLDEPARIAPLFEQVVAEIASGALRPLPRQRFSAGDAPAAFRLMQQARHVGKVVLTWPCAGAGDAPVRSDGAYLITGGLGGLGLRVAEWLAGRGAGRILLMSRRPDIGDLETKLDAIRRHGADVDIVAGDVSREADVADVLGAIAGRGLPLRGVVHAAGVLDDGVLVDQTVDRFERVMAPKVFGAWHLHRLTSAFDLDFFVLFSSTASLVGSAGQANHAAANAYLDALAHYRRQLGLPGLSVNWGAWAEIGAAASDSARGFLQSHGLFPLEPERALAALGSHLSDPGAAQIAVAAVDWPAFLARRPASPFFSAQAAAKTDDSPATNLLDQFERAPREEQAGVLRRFLRDEVAAVLGMTQPDKVAFNLGFFELGMDSLTSVEFRNNIQTKLGCRVAATVAFDFPTIDALTGHLLETHPMARALTTAEIAEELARELAESEEGGVLSEREL